MRPEVITLREIEASDLEIFYRQQLDPEANRMAAFVGKDPSDRGTFDARWTKILATDTITKRAIVTEGQVAGHISFYPDEGHLEATYWLGKEYWGRGLTTEALRQMLALVVVRPIFARVATDNLASLRVLQKCGFAIIGNDRGYAHGRGWETEEFVLRLDS